MTPAQKNIILKLLKGYFLRQQKRGKKTAYILFDEKINPIQKLKNNIIKVIHSNVPQKFEIMKYSKHGDISFNLSVVRQLHGNHTIKRLYKMRDKLDSSGSIYKSRTKKKAGSFTNQSQSTLF